MFRRTRITLLSIGLLAAAGLCSRPATAQLIGPYPDANTPYLSFANSPFNGGTFPTSIWKISRITCSMFRA